MPADLRLGSHTLRNKRSSDSGKASYTLFSALRDSREINRILQPSMEEKFLIFSFNRPITGTFGATNQFAFSVSLEAASNVDATIRMFMQIHIFPNAMKYSNDHRKRVKIHSLTLKERQDLLSLSKRNRNKLNCRPLVTRLWVFTRLRDVSRWKNVESAGWRLYKIPKVIFPSTKTSIKTWIGANIRGPYSQHTYQSLPSNETETYALGKSSTWLNSTVATARRVEELVY